MYVYRCSKNLMDHVPAMKVLNQTFFCKSVYSGTYDNEFIISCRHEIYGEVKSRSELPTYVPAAHRGLVNKVTLKNSSKEYPDQQFTRKPKTTHCGVCITLC